LESFNDALANWISQNHSYAGGASAIMRERYHPEVVARSIWKFTGKCWLTTDDMYSQPQRIEFLDSIRGLAALFVLLGHTLGAFDWPASFVAKAHWPFISICLRVWKRWPCFLFLSGYVLSKPYVGNRRLLCISSANILPPTAHSYLAALVFRFLLSVFFAKVSVFSSCNTNRRRQNA